MTNEELMNELMKTSAHLRRPMPMHAHGPHGGRPAPADGENRPVHGFGHGCKPCARPENAPETAANGEASAPKFGADRKPGAWRAFGNILGLLSAKSPLSQQEIADSLGIRPQSVSEALTKMEAHGLITKEASTDDARVSLVSLTEKGAQVHAFAAAEREKHAAFFFSVLTDEEKAQLFTILGKLNAPREFERHCHGKGRGRGRHCCRKNAEADAADADNAAGTSDTENGAN